jgi:hypothetical protein
MLKLATRFSAVLAAMMLVAGALPAAAAESDISTQAFTNHPLPLYDDFGRYHDALGMLPGGIAVRVDRCSRAWCNVHGRFGHGWVSLYGLSFGQGPNSIWWPPLLRHGPYHPWRFWGD